MATEFHDLFLNAAARHGAAVAPLESERHGAWPPHQSTAWCVLDEADECPEPALVFNADARTGEVEAALRAGTTAVVDRTTAFKPSNM